MAEQAPTLTAIVVNYNAGTFLYNCVRALLSSDVPLQVRVWDNASGDESLVRVRAEFADCPQLTLHCHDDNIGFARAVNACAREATTDFLLIVNPDCELASGAAGELLAAAADDVHAGLAAPRIEDPEGVIEPASLRRFPRPWNSFVTVTGLSRLARWLPVFQGVNVDKVDTVQRTVQAEAVSGACMLVRRDALVEVGFFDESYGLHCEDLDLMYRLQRAGWDILYVPEARAVHHQGVSSRSRPLWVHGQKHLGMARFYRKFLARKYLLPVSWLVLLGIWIHYALLLPLVWLRK